VRNTSASYDTNLIAAVKSFIEQAAKANNFGKIFDGQWIFFLTATEVTVLNVFRGLHYKRFTVVIHTLHRIS